MVGEKNDAAIASRNAVVEIGCPQQSGQLSLGFAQ